MEHCRSWPWILHVAQRGLLHISHFQSADCADYMWWVALCQVTLGGNFVSVDPLPALSLVRVDQEWKLHKIWKAEERPWLSLSEGLFGVPCSEGWAKLILTLLCIQTTGHADQQPRAPCQIPGYRPTAETKARAPWKPHHNPTSQSPFSPWNMINSSAWLVYTLHPPTCPFTPSLPQLLPHLCEI